MTDTPQNESKLGIADPMERLLHVMQRLRDPKNGCPWDIEQTFETIAPYTIEEAYEVAEAITLNDMDALKDELGDLLLQVVYHAQMASEEKAFDFNDVADAISEKMVRRHPHVFAGQSIETAEAQTAAWEAQKAAERAQKAEAEGRTASILDGVSAAYPALMRAVKIQKRVVRVGFDWPETRGVFDKIEEELEELEVEVGGWEAGDHSEQRREDIEDEMGDLLFTVVNLARHLNIDPETALRRCNAKFEMRFRYMESALTKDGKNIEDSSIDVLEELWQEAKSAK